MAFADFLLTETADFFSSNIRTIDTLSRFDHDHFFIQIEDLMVKDTLVKVAERMRNNYTSHIENRLEITPSISIGLVYCSSEYLWPEDIITDADIALYVAKSDPEHRIVAFNPSIHGAYRQPDRYPGIQRVGLSPKDPTKPRE